MQLPFQRPAPDSVPPSGASPKRSRKTAQAASDATVELARARARRRLFGAVVLLAIGIVAFPMLFDSRPRPLAHDTPIQIAQRDPQGTTPPALQATPARPAGADEPAETVLESNPRPGTANMPAPAVAPAAQQDPAREVPPPERTAEPAPSSATTPPAPTPEPAAEKAKPAPTPAPNPTAMPTLPRSDDGARARALLEGAPVPPAAAPSSERFVVQVGAYSEEAALRDARSRVEKLGLKSYTQVIANNAGRHTRVRVGPFTSRTEADAAAAKLKRGGLPASVLTL